ncbi:MAG: hypothetical protein KC592_05980, partial [Nitrospira sp.]|nr:hypothetical protein [Nitrospira sp.]
LSHCEAGLSSCLQFQETQIHTIWYTWPQFAQKHAQFIWNRLARMDRLAWFSNYQLIPFKPTMLESLPDTYDWIYLWIPFSDYSNPSMIGRWGNFLKAHLSRGSVACVAGPSVLGENLQKEGFQIVHAAAGDSMPTFRIHRTILPNGWLNPDLWIWVIQHL